MIYPHQQKTIDYITQKFLTDPEIDALFVSGSIAHGFNDEFSDIDIIIVISESQYQQRKNNNAITYWESAENFYQGGYIDGKYITLEHLSIIAESGNEPTKFAFHDLIIAFDKTNLCESILKRMEYPADNYSKNVLRFLAQIEVWKWYCEEAIKKDDKYLLDTSVTRFILFIGRLILLDNKMYFPYHKWLIKVLETAPDKPKNLMEYISNLLENKTIKNISNLFELVIKHKDWKEGKEYSCSSYFANDVELNWMRGNEFIENI